MPHYHKSVSRLKMSLSVVHTVHWECYQKSLAQLPFKRHHSIHPLGILIATLNRGSAPSLWDTWWFWFSALKKKMTSPYTLVSSIHTFRFIDCRNWWRTASRLPSHWNEEDPSSLSQYVWCECNLGKFGRTHARLSSETYCVRYVFRNLCTRI